MRRLNILFLLCCTLLWACQIKDPEVNTNLRKIHEDTYPLESSVSPSSLVELWQADSTHVIHYRVARIIAMMELQEGLQNVLDDTYPFISFQDGELCQTPNIVFGIDGKPKYYEFGYVVNGWHVATITTFAQRENVGVIYCVLPYYTIVEPQYKQYSSRYPQKFMTTWGDIPAEIDTLFNNIDTLPLNERIYNEMVDNMPLEDRDILGEQQDLLSAFSISVHDFWDSVDNILYFSNSFYRPEYSTPEEMEEEDELWYQTLANQLGISSDYDYDIIDEYNHESLARTRWNGYCGPAALSWIYRGKYDSYPISETYLPIWGDTGLDSGKFDFIDSTLTYKLYCNVIGLSRADAIAAYANRSQYVDNYLSGTFYEETVPTFSLTNWKREWVFPLYHGGINRGLQNATNGEYEVEFTIYPDSWIRNKREPVLIAIHCNHYVVAFGTAYIGQRNQQYFLVTDNGSETEHYGHRPFWMKHSGWWLHYGLKDNF